MIKQILVPVDFSPASLQALDYAIELGRPFKAQLAVLHVVEPISVPSPGAMYGGGYDASIIYRELERIGRERLAQLAAELRSRRVTARTLLSCGIAHQAITDTARKLKTDLIVMSTHGRTGFSHVLMGSVAERVVRTAACPVLTMRTLESMRRRRARRLSGRRATRTGARTRRAAAAHV